MYLADVGVAQVLTKGTVSTTRTNSSSSTIGTPGFKRIEQLKAGEIEERIDIYAVGCVLVELFGEKIWEGLSAIQIMVKVAVEEQVPTYDHLPESVWPLCKMCLQPREKGACASMLLYNALTITGQTSIMLANLR